MAVEEVRYSVASRDAAFEIRDYLPYVVAETLVEGGLEDAGNAAFDRLFRYISGANRAQQPIAMTAPVAQAAAGEKIAMTAPVSQQRRQDRWAVSFAMPAGQTLATLPQPEDARVLLRAVPAQRMAAVRYSGFWSESRYLEHRAALESWMAARGLAAAGEPVWARYDPPFMPWFLRRNEILVPLDAAPAAAPARP